MATQTKIDPAILAEDIGNLALLEHVNTQIDDQGVASLFYLVGLGFTRDPHMMVGVENMWVNLGEQQFHIPTNTPQVLRGHCGLVTPNLDALADRLTSVEQRLAGTKFAWSREDGYIAATSPWGNRFRIYEAGQPEASGIRVGMPYVQFETPRGSSEGIAAFYTEVIGAPATVKSSKAGDSAEVPIGQYQRLIFQEVDEVAEYDGHHIAVYLTNFSQPYAELSERGLITEEPRNHQYRFLDIVEPRSNKPLFRIEHEVRSSKHPLYRRPLVNRNVGEFLEPRRINGQTVLGSVG
jgi:hypothetical protein